jgi:hypothetical protein
MAIEIQVLHRNDPAALAELIAQAIPNVVLEPESGVAHLTAVVHAEEREMVKRRDSWRWLNSISPGVIDRDNDWSGM